ncbi:MAG: restriction endonuclease subunit S, partial [Rudaea sp.]
MNYELVPVTDLIELHDHLREPVSQTERNKREEKYPYYGATGQVGWIDDFRQDGEYVLLGEDGAPFLDLHKPKAYRVSGKCWVNNHAHVLRGKDGICDNDYLCFALNWVDYSDAVTGSTRLKLPQSTM